MKKNKLYNKKFLTNMVKKLSTDTRISKIFLLGSYGHKGKSTMLSDLDLWIILSEESGLNSFKNELEIIFNKFGRLYGVYESTAHHFFIIYKEYLQIDLNLASSATYCNLTNPKNKKILFSSTFVKKHKIKEDNKVKFRENLLNGFTTLERGMSKYH
jgi:predicted nucleotidyltransferase